GSTNLCPGESVGLTASVGNSYHWSTGATSRGINVNTTGTYTVNITYAEGCILEASVNVVVGALSKAHVFASNNGHPYNCNNPVVDLNQDTYAEYDQYTFSWYKVGLQAPIIFESPTSYLQVNQPGEYYLIVKRNDCTSDTSDHLIVIYDNGDPSVLGDHNWNVYVWQNEPPSPQNPNGGLSYKGYYTELEISFDTRIKWPEFLSPSFAPGFHGCSVLQDFFKWSAKRKGFIPGNYSIRIPAYDQSAFLKINGLQVWSDVCCSNSGSNIIWNGHLDADSEIEFSVTEELGSAFGAIQFELSGCAVSKPTISVNGSTEICQGNTINLTTQSGFETYIWMNGENIIPGANTNSIQVNDTGHYTVKVIVDTCVSEKSEPVVITILPIKTYYRDSDGDGFGNSLTSIQSCVAQQGYVMDHTDCDDNNILIHPGAVEICDGKDNNCDGNIDEGITAPLIPSVTVIQPTCLLTTGTITITNKSSVDSASFNNGLTYQISNIKSGILPGNYLIKIKSVQGCLSDVLSVTINAIGSIPLTPIVSVVQPTCGLLAGSITVTNKSVNDSASFNNGISYQIADTKSGFSPGTYTIKIKNILGCVSTSISVTISPVSSVIAAPKLNIIQPTCAIPSGTITITNKAISDSASFDQGLSYQISNIKSGLIPGNYFILLKNSGTCVSASTKAVINPISSNTETPVLKITQPSCTVLSGTIEVTNKAKKDSVSFNNGVSYQISATKTGLITGNYQVMIKTVQGCVSNFVLVLINVAPQVPALPVVTIIQPTCQSPFGIIEITNKTITDSASFDNGKTYQISNIKTNLIQGKYIVLVKNIGGCTSGPLSVTINALTSAPAIPKATIVQPTCLIPTGSITITNKATTDSASFDNGLSYQISNIKSGLPPGTYFLRIKNSTGCISNSMNAVIHPVQNNLAAPIIYIIQPSCTVSTGTIEVSNKAKKDSVSFNNGITYQISNSKAGLTSGNYMIIIKTTAGCSSSPVLAVINNAASVPSNPLLQLIQPSCFNPTGTITITNKSALDSASFNNGLSYQISEIKSGLPPGTYSVKIKNHNSCISGSTQVVIVVSPGALTAPSLNITQPTCITLTGTISISNKAITDSASFNNGLTYRIGNSINNLSPGTYLIKLKSPSGCTSPSSTGIINPLVPLTVSITNLDTIYYRNTTAFTMIASPGGGVFKIDGTIPTQDKFNPTTLSLSSHTVTYTLSKNGCTAIDTRQVKIKTFSLEGEGSQCYGIQDSLNTKLYAGVLNGSIAANIEINQQTYLDSLYQKWIVTDVNGYKRIRNKKSGLYLKVLSNGNVVQGAWETVSSEWVLVPNAKMNSFSLFSRLKEKYLTLGKKNIYTLASASGNSGPGSDQRFNFIKVNCTNTLSLTSNADVLETRESISKPFEPITIEIYPNPNKGLFTVHFNHLDLYQKPILTIYTLLGQKIWEQKVEYTSPIKIQLSGDVISNGMYLVKLKSGNEIVLKNMLISN
ncbi:MAG: MopE-related protein, partial [Saprospiraceae bacterium]